MRKHSRKWDRAKQAGFRADEIPDLLQDIAVAVIERPDLWQWASKSRRKQLLWVLTRNTLGKIRRTEDRRRRRDEQKASMTEEAYCDNAGPISLDVQNVVAGLDERCQTVCELLSEGLSRADIAERLQCNWHTADRLVRTFASGLRPRRWTNGCDSRQIYPIPGK